MSEQIYQYPNKPILNDNDLFLLSDESTINHDLKNIAAAQAKAYFSTATTGTYTPIFSNFTGGINVTSNLVSAYTAINQSVGTWVQVAIKVAVTLGGSNNESFEGTIPFGGNFQNVLDALMVGGALDVTSVTAAYSPFKDVSAVVGSNRIKLNLRINPNILGIVTTMAFSFVYKIY